MNNVIALENGYLKELNVDSFHHLGFSSATVDLESTFSDVKVVCVAGSQNRVTKFANCVNKELNPDSDDPVNICKTDRYVVYKVGPIVLASHGMGVPSMSIILNELIKVLHYARATNVVFFRIGTCGGLGIEPGSVVLSKTAVDGLFRPFHEKIVLGKTVQYPSHCSEEVVEELLSYKMDAGLLFDVIAAKTMCTDDFYEGQARLDGAFCSYSKEESKAYLKDAHKHGIRNIEMESLVFASMCHRAGTKAAVICVVLVNRFEGDQVQLSKDQLQEFQMRPLELLLHYIKKHVHTKQCNHS